MFDMIFNTPTPTLPAAQSWSFDLWSALIGAVVTLLLVGIIYLFREELRLGWESLTAPVTQLRDQLQASAEERYHELVGTWARSTNALSHVASLDDIFVAPLLRCPPPLPKSASEAELSEPQTLPLSRVLGDHPRLLVRGDPGTGKTTVLAHLALMCIKALGKDGSQTIESTPEAIRDRTPLYVSLPALNWEREESEDEAEELEAEQEASETAEDNGDEQKDEERRPQQKDAVERLLDAAVSIVGGSGRLESMLREYLEAGQALVLIDGWDELTEQQRQQASIWLSELLDRLPDNLWIATAGMRGYAPITELGFVPLTLASWNNDQVTSFARRWIETSTPPDGDAPVPLPVLTSELQQAARAGATPLALTLRAFVYLSDQEASAKRAALFDRVLTLLLEPEEEEEAPWLRAACRAVLGEVALELQHAAQATIDKDEITSTIEAALPPPGERPARATAQVLEILTDEKGLLRSVGNQHYTFVHPLWQAYLTARQLVAADPDTLIEKLDDPHWSEALRFYAEIGDMRPLVATLLRSPDDLFYTRLQTLSAWANAAPKDAEWLKQVMATLARKIVQPDQHPMLRQTLAQAIARTSVPGLSYFFKQALQHPSAEVRQAGIAGLGKIATISDLSLIDIALQDEEPAVREEAIRALARLGGDAAVRRLESIVKEADERTRAVAAEALAQYMGEESRSLLEEMSESEDVAARRAAVFGLAELGARERLEQLARHDEQWIVRSAATMALEVLDEQKQITGITPPPKIDDLPWLVSWAAARGEGIGTGEAARRTLWQALHEGEPSIRLAAAQVLAQVGRPDDIEPLRSLLPDATPEVSRAALEALNEIRRRYDLTIE